MIRTEKEREGRVVKTKENKIYSFLHREKDKRKSTSFPSIKRSKHSRPKKNQKKQNEKRTTTKV